MEDFYFGETCRLYQDRVEVEYRLAGQVINEVRKISGASLIEKLISQAEQENITENPNMICDGPSTTVIGLEKVLLYSTGGCGTPKQIREGGAAFTLMTLVGKYCPETH